MELSPHMIDSSNESWMKMYWGCINRERERERREGEGRREGGEGGREEGGIGQIEEWKRERERRGKIKERDGQIETNIIFVITQSFFLNKYNCLYQHRNLAVHTATPMCGQGPHSSHGNNTYNPLHLYLPMSGPCSSYGNACGGQS